MEKQEVERKEAGNTISTHRLEALSDAVFAVVMTLLVLDLKVPDIVADHISDDWSLAQSLETQWPKLISYIVSFLLVGVYWVGTNNTYRFVKRANRQLTWLNIIFLMITVFIPFTTAMLAADSDVAGKQFRLPSIIYGVQLILLGLSSYIMWRYIGRHPELADEPISTLMKRNILRRSLLVVASAALGIAISFLSVTASTLTYLIIVLVYVGSRMVGRSNDNWL